MRLNRFNQNEGSRHQSESEYFSCDEGNGEHENVLPDWLVAARNSTYYSSPERENPVSTCSLHLALQLASQAQHQPPNFQTSSVSFSQKKHGCRLKANTQTNPTTHTSSRSCPTHFTSTKTKIPSSRFQAVHSSTSRSIGSSIVSNAKGESNPFSPRSHQYRRSNPPPIRVAPFSRQPSSLDSALRGLSVSRNQLLVSRINKPSSVESLSCRTVQLQKTEVQSPLITNKTPDVTHKIERFKEEKRKARTKAKTHRQLRRKKNNDGEEEKKGEKSVVSKKTLDGTTDGWSNSQVSALVKAMMCIQIGCHGYWELVAQSMGCQKTAEECAKKAVRLEEEKLFAASHLSTPQETLDEIKSKLPAKGNTRTWRMNQLIQKMAFKQKSEDLLKSSTFDSQNQKTKQQLDGKHKESLFYSDDANHSSMGSISKIPTLFRSVSQVECSPIKDTKEESDQKENSNVRTPEFLLSQHSNSNTSTCSRASIPSWVMTPQQLQQLSNFHTGLTPRIKKEDSPTIQANPKNRKLTAAKRKPDHIEHEACAESSEESDPENQEYSRFASDVLMAIEPNRTLQQQRLIDRHKKKAQAKEKVPKRPMDSSRFDVFESQHELDNVLEKHQMQQRRQQRQANIQSLKWMKENAKLEVERLEAADELNCMIEDTESDANDSDDVLI